MSLTVPMMEAVAALCDEIHAAWPEVVSTFVSWESSDQALDVEDLPAAFVALGPIEIGVDSPSKQASTLDLEVVYAEQQEEGVWSYATAYGKIRTLIARLEANPTLQDGGGDDTCSRVFIGRPKPGVQCALAEWADRTGSYLGMCGLALQIWTEETR